MSVDDYMLPCLNKKIFGVDCFGCGAQRSFFMLLDGEFFKAFQLFPAIYTLLPFLLVVGFHFIDKKRNYVPYILVLGVINTVVMLLSYIYRQYIGFSCPIS